MQMFKYGVLIIGSVIAGYLINQSTSPTPLSNKCIINVVEWAPLPEFNAQLVSNITSRYKNVSPELATKIVIYTAMYAKPTFPKQEDLLAVIAVESAFNPAAKSNLKTDPAIGLTQIRPGAWRHKIKKSELSDIEGQIKYGAYILEHNYNRVNSKALALHAYNLGLTAALRGVRSKTYVVKYQREFKALTSV